MSTKRLFILAAVLIICCSGFSAQAAETKSGAQAAQAAGSNTDAQAAQAGAVLPDFLNPEARRAMEEAMKAQARPDAARCIAETITAS